MKTNKALALFAVIAPVAVATGVAVAFDPANPGNEAGVAQMTNALTLLVAYLDGPLGTIFAIVAFAIGLGITAATQSMMGIAGGLFVALLANYGASIIVAVTGSAESSL